MMGKDSTTTQIDFLLLEEVSNEAAETISGGALTVTAGQELELGDIHLYPIETGIKFLESMETLAGLLGITIPKPKLPDLSGYLPKPPMMENS